MASTIAANPARLREVERRNHDDVVRLRQAMRMAEHRHYDFVSQAPEFVHGLHDPVSSLELALLRIGDTDGAAVTYGETFHATQQVLAGWWPTPVGGDEPAPLAPDTIVRSASHRISGRAISLIGLEGAVELETETMASGASRIIYRRSAGPAFEVGAGGDIEVDTKGMEWADDIAKASASIGSAIEGGHDRIWTVAPGEDLDRALVAVAADVAGVDWFLRGVDAGMGMLMHHAGRLPGFSGTERPARAVDTPDEMASRHTLTVETTAAAQFGVTSIAGLAKAIAGHEELPAPELSVSASEHVTFEHRDNHPNVIEIGLTLSGDTGLADALEGMPSSGELAVVLRVPDLADPRRIDVELSHATGHGREGSERTVVLGFDLDEPDASAAAADLIATAGVADLALAVPTLAVPLVHANRARLRRTRSLVAGEVDVAGVSRRASSTRTSSRSRTVSASFGVGAEMELEATIETETRDTTHDR